MTKIYVPMSNNYEGPVRFDQEVIMAFDPNAYQKKYTMNQNHLKRVWDCSQQATKEDWLEWFQRLCIEFLRESPAHALRACANLASLYLPLARELFNASFISCWPELYDQFQDELMNSFHIALSSSSIPVDILQVLLNLAEYMERNDKALPISNKDLGRSAEKCQAFAKALHYQEAEYLINPNEDTIECLIGIYTQLQMREAAAGLVRAAQHHADVEIKPLWYERLGQWDEALNTYASKIKKGHEETDALLGRMRCLHALGEWKDLSKVCDMLWRTKHELHAVVAPYATYALWGLNSLEGMKVYANSIEPHHGDSDILRAVMKIMSHEFDAARDYISHARNQLNSKIPALVAESYSRAYDALVNLQALEEMEEVIRYKLEQRIEKKRSIQNIWTKR
jgi:FKBP12-rapamycin complex-associated protein